MRKSSPAIVFAALLATTQPSWSQAEAILGIFGGIISEGMRQERLNNQQQRVRPQRQPSQQWADPQREAQIAQTRRIQTGLSSLGFYTMKIDGSAGPGTNRAIETYQRAFALPYRPLTEADIQQLEAHASQGFRSLDQLRTAREQGFETAVEWEAARSAGFGNAQQWREAQRMGVFAYQDFRTIRDAGFSDADSFRDARQRGFPDRQTMVAARDAGFNDFSSFDTFLRQQAAEVKERELAALAPKFTPVSRPDVLAIVIGNKNYVGAPDVQFAHNDAEGFARYFTDVMGVEPRKVILEMDITSVGMASLFGRPGGPDGRLHRMARFVDEIYVFYSGHGVPEIRQDGPARGYLLPVDVPPASPGFGAYALDDLIAQLESLPVAHVTLLLDACFSGLSEGGSLVPNVSGAFGVAVATPAASARISVLAATAFDEPQLAHWLPDREHGAFSFYTLQGLHGAADRQDGRRVRMSDLRSYIDEALTFEGFNQRPSLRSSGDDPLMVDFTGVDDLPVFVSGQVKR